MEDRPSVSNCELRADGLRLGGAGQRYSNYKVDSPSRPQTGSARSIVESRIERKIIGKNNVSVTSNSRFTIKAKKKKCNVGGSVLNKDKTKTKQSNAKKFKPALRNYKRTLNEKHKNSAAFICTTQKIQAELENTNLRTGIKMSNKLNNYGPTCGIETTEANSNNVLSAQEMPRKSDYIRCNQTGTNYHKPL